MHDEVFAGRCLRVDRCIWGVFCENLVEISQTQMETLSNLSETLDSATPVLPSVLAVPRTSHVIVSSIVYAGLVAVSIALYGFLKNVKPEIWAPRTFFERGWPKQKRNVGDTIGVDERKSLGKKSWSYRSISSWLTSCFCGVDICWPWKLLWLNEEYLIEYCGISGFTMLRIVRFLWFLSAIYCLAVAALFLPVLYSFEISAECKTYCQKYSETFSGRQPFDAQCLCNFIDRSSIASLPSGEAALWAPVITICVITFTTLYFSCLEYEEMVRIQTNSWKKSPEAYSILVERVPNHLRCKSGARLKDYFSRIFPKMIMSVQMVDTGSKDFRDLVDLGHKRNYLVWRLERMRALLLDPNVHSTEGYKTNNSRKQYMLLNMQEELSLLDSRFSRLRKLYLGPCIEKAEHVSAGFRSFPVPYLERSSLESIRNYDVRVFDESDAATASLNSDKPENPFENNETKENHDSHFFSAAFITFRGLTASSVSSQSQIDDSSDMQVSAAPEPLDIVWDNIGMSSRSRMLRRILTKSLFYLIVLFWGVFTSFVGAFTSTDSLANKFPFVEALIEKFPNLVFYLNQLAPLVLVSLLSIVSPLITYAARCEGRVCCSNADRVALERYFIFLVIQVFIFYGVAGTVFKMFVEIIQTPNAIVHTLGKTIPKNASFYIEFVIVKTFWMLCFELLRISHLSLALLRRVITGPTLTAREQRSIFCGCFASTYPAPISIPTTLAQMLLVFLIATVYAVIQPLILPAAFVFLVVAVIVYTTVLTSSSESLYECNGRFWWATSYRCIMLALLTAQLTLLGVLLIKRGYTQQLPMWILVFATVYFAYKIERRFYPQMSNVSVQLTSSIDRERSNMKMVQIRPDCWHYGAVMPGSNKRFDKDVVIVYSYRHPVLEEPNKVEVAESTFDYGYQKSSGYGTMD